MFFVGKIDKCLDKMLRKPWFSNQMWVSQIGLPPEKSSKIGIVWVLWAEVATVDLHVGQTNCCDLTCGKSIHQSCFQLGKLKFLNRQKRGLVYTKILFKGKRRKIHIHQRGFNQNSLDRGQSRKTSSVNFRGPD